MPVATAKMLGSKMMSSGGKSSSVVSSSKAREQISTLRSTESAWPLLVERHHDHRRAVIAADPRLGEELARRLPSCEIELTTDLPCTHSSPASITSNLDESIITGHAGDVGLGGDQVEERHHRLARVEQTLVHVDVDHLGAVLDLVAGDVEGLGEVAVLDQPAELGGAR